VVARTFNLAAQTGAAEEVARPATRLAGVGRRAKAKR